MRQNNKQKGKWRKRADLFFMAAGILLILSAVLLLSHNKEEDKKAGQAAEEILPELKESIETAEDGDPDLGLSVDGEKYIGYLTIPSLGIELPVAKDWDYTKLKKTPCRYYGSTETDDLVICGHNYDRHFGRLKNLAAGDEIVFTSADGETTEYEVAALETLQPDETEYMKQSGYDLTLYTCTYGGQSRVTVRCSRT